MTTPINSEALWPTSEEIEMASSFFDSLPNHEKVALCQQYGFDYEDNGAVTVSNEDKVLLWEFECVK